MNPTTGITGAGVEPIAPFADILIVNFLLAANWTLAIFTRPLYMGLNFAAPQYVEVVNAAKSAKLAKIG